MLALASDLSDHDLLARIGELADKERETSIELVAHLAALETRPALYAAQGHGSLFSYCTRVLHLSEDAACNRIDAARACRRFPAILDLMASGALSLTTVRMLRSHLTPENHEAVLARASGRSCREIEALVAELAPRPDVPASVRKLPDPTPRRVPGTPAAPPLFEGSIAVIADRSPSGCRSRPSSRHRGDVARALSRPVHGRPGGSRHAAAASGPAAPRDPERRRGHDRGARAEPASREGGEGKVRGDVQAAAGYPSRNGWRADTGRGPDAGRPFARHTRSGSARGLAEGWRAMRLRQQGWREMPRALLPGVSSRPALRAEGDRPASTTSRSAAGGTTSTRRSSFSALALPGLGRFRMVCRVSARS